MSDKCWKCGRTFHTGGCGCDDIYGLLPHQLDNAKDAALAALREENERLVKELTITTGAYEHAIEEANLANQENERLKAVLHGAGYQNIDNLKNESVDKCTLLGLTAKLITEREIRARVDMTDEAARLRESLAAAGKRLENAKKYLKGCGAVKLTDKQIDELLGGGK